MDKKPDWNVNSINPLYLLINRVYETVNEKNGVKCITIHKGDFVLKTYDQVFAGIKYHIKKISEEVVYGNDFDKIKFLNDDSLPLGKLIYFPTLIVDSS